VLTGTPPLLATLVLPGTPPLLATLVLTGTPSLLATLVLTGTPSLLATLVLTGTPPILATLVLTGTQSLLATLVLTGAPSLLATLVLTGTPSLLPTLVLTGATSLLATPVASFHNSHNIAPCLHSNTMCTSCAAAVPSVLSRSTPALLRATTPIGERWIEKYFHLHYCLTLLLYHEKCYINSKTRIKSQFIAVFLINILRQWFLLKYRQKHDFF
jgi:hypothetical protein